MLAAPVTMRPGRKGSVALAAMGASADRSPPPTMETVVLTGFALSEGASSQGHDATSSSNPKSLNHRLTVLAERETTPFVRPCRSLAISS